MAILTQWSFTLNVIQYLTLCTISFQPTAAPTADPPADPSASSFSSPEVSPPVSAAAEVTALDQPRPNPTNAKQDQRTSLLQQVREKAIY